MFDRTKELCRRAKIALPPAATDNSFAKRLRGFRSVVETTVKRKKTKEKYMALHTKITELNAHRDRIVHGLWEFDPSQPELLFNFSLRPPHDAGHIKWYTMKSMGELSVPIGEVTYALGVSSRGLMKKGVSPFASLSRRFLLDMAAIPPEERGDPEYIHPKPRFRRSSAPPKPDSKDSPAGGRKN